MPENRNLPNRGHVLTWLYASVGRCGECMRLDKRYHALENNDTDAVPICAACLEKVENEVQERRRRKGMQCAYCNRNENLRATFHKQRLKFVMACPVCKAKNEAREIKANQ